MNKNDTIYIAGHRGLVGGAIYRHLQNAGYTKIMTRTHAELDLTNQAAVNAFFSEFKPEYIFLAAAKVGGIHANNTYSGQFIRDNLLIQTHIIDAAYRNAAHKLLFLGSSCIYPKFAPQPIKEDYLLTGPLEETNEAYAVAKIAGIKTVENYRKQYGFNGISLMPTNLYGPGDNFDLQNSHVLPALIRKFHEAKLAEQADVVVWGSGKPRREFLFSEDLAGAAVFLMQQYSGAAIINVGVGEDVSIAELASLVGDVVGYTGKIVYDASKPDGTPRKLLDVSRLHDLGWRAQVSLREGIARTYHWYLDNQQK
ncbi:MAG: GDP-L-fucose synthase [Pseudomonadota bacterium]